MQLLSSSVAKRAMPHQLSLVQGSVRSCSPSSMLGVRPVNIADIDIVVMWNDATAFVKTCPLSASLATFGVAILD